MGRIFFRLPKRRYVLCIILYIKLERKGIGPMALKTAFLALLFLLSPALTFAGSITIAADPCSVPLARALAEAYSKKTKGFKAEVSSFACTLGVYKAAKGEFDIGVSTQNGLSSNLPKGAVNRVIAKSPIVMVVNRKNPVNGISYSSLQGIVSGKIKNWNEAGGVDIQIKNVMLAPCVRHTVSKQVAIYADGMDILTPEKKTDPITDTNRLVEENEGAIGQQIFGYESDRVKALSIDGVMPDEKTVPGEYTLFQDFNIVTKGKAQGAVKGFIEFAASEEARAVIKSLKHIPIN